MPPDRRSPRAPTTSAAAPLSRPPSNPRRRSSGQKASRKSSRPSSRSRSSPSAASTSTTSNSSPPSAFIARASSARWATPPTPSGPRDVSVPCWIRFERPGRWRARPSGEDQAVPRHRVRRRRHGRDRGRDRLRRGELRHVRRGRPLRPGLDDRGGRGLALPRPGGRRPGREGRRPRVGSYVARHDRAIGGGPHDRSLARACAPSLALGSPAAKGAYPAWVLTSLAMPKHWTVDHLTGLYSGMSELGKQVRVGIVGGDMSATAGPAILSVTVVGRTIKLPLARAQAQPGWSVAVTGPLGAAAVALRERRAFRLVPKLEEGRRLNELGLCCGDISDGLVREMERFAAMAKVGSG